MALAAAVFGRTAIRAGSTERFCLGWSLLAKVPAGGSNTLDGVNFTWPSRVPARAPGTWTLTADQNVTLDLVCAMHAGGFTDAVLFDDQAMVANAVTPGTWEIHWVNDGGEHPAFSNLTLAAHDIIMSKRRRRS